MYIVCVCIVCQCGVFCVCYYHCRSTVVNIFCKILPANGILVLCTNDNMYSYNTNDYDVHTELYNTNDYCYRVITLMLVIKALN